MKSFSNRLRICIDALEAGHEIELESGHKLAWVDDYEGPGFLGYNETDKQEIVFQINSDVAWRSLILHARNMSFDDSFILSAETAMTKMNRERYGVRK